MKKLFSCAAGFCFVASLLLCGGCVRPGKSVPPPVLSPEESLGHFRLEKDFEIRLVAAEPLVSAPVAMSFDDKGRIWVVEMEGYMPDTAGTGENRPNGKIVILEDTNHDGVMDRRKVFMDSLVLPRAICLIKNGVLVAEPPKLWFVENRGDSAGKKYLVDSAYAAGGNVEHQPNGLLRALDNWIYSAKSDKRYRLQGDRWIIEHTHFRGQWGISQDDQGRLFYNTNSDNLLGDYFPPGLSAWNTHQRRVRGFDENIVPDNRTYPIHATPGVNRGYVKGILDDSLRLISFTAACGPVIFRGDAWGKDYDHNAFVAEPAANLVKRNLLRDEGNRVAGRQAWQGKEFLASNDERFRPVNLCQGPDGALYIVDMYRGIIQHKTYLTSYLKEEIKKRALTQPLNCGRIYKIFPRGAKLRFPATGKDPRSLADSLDSGNPWVRDISRQLLTDRYPGGETASLLGKKLEEDKNNTGRIEALWALEGLGALSSTQIDRLLQSDNRLLRRQALTAAVDGMNNADVLHWLAACRKIFSSADSLMMPYVAAATAKAMQLAPAAARPLLLQVAGKYRNDPFVTDAVISGLENKEQAFLKEYLKAYPDTAALFPVRLKKVLADMERKKEAMANHRSGKQFERGLTLFQSICQTCHGSDGNGIHALGPPLNGSDWIQGDKERLLSVVLFGLTGPVKVSGKLYKVPEVGTEMPGIGANDQLSDDDIAQITSFIRNAWNNKAPAVKAEDVRKVREKYRNRQQPFTTEELQ